MEIKNKQYIFLSKILTLKTDEHFTKYSLLSRGIILENNVSLNIKTNLMNCI